MHIWAKIIAHCESYSYLYGLTRDELNYTPCCAYSKEIYSENFPSEVFRALKEKAIR
ncbi:MAG: hypothetical protein KPEEDBHJ_03371 [Anaerolineales bacterium]|nr:hypothetical protein [Anaerolineales bacterium]